MSDRPFVVWSYAATLDGRSAAADGSSRWISSPAALRDTHRLRAECDAILVGTQTVLDDDPSLTARDADGNLLPRQPLRAVMGLREVAAGRKVLDGAAETLLLRTRDPGVALTQLTGRGVKRVLLEGGPTLAAAFLAAHLVDEVIAYIAPMLLGAGRPAVADFGVGTIGEALGGAVTDITVIDGDPGDAPNVRITLRPTYRR